MSAAELDIEGRRVGAGSPVLVVAEVGANHDGDVGRAHQLVDVAADSGCDAVKFQTYTSAELVADADRVVAWGPPGRERREPVGAMFDRLSLPRSAHAELFDHARDRGLVPFSTPFSLDGVDFLASIGCPAIKIASSDVGHVQLVAHAAATGLPVILSTGKSTLAEIDAAVGALRPGPFALLHCIASYPAPRSSLNLRAVRTLAAAYPDAVVGFSDHSIGTFGAVVAVTLGARIVEKHITLSKDIDGPDHWFSADPDELAALVTDVRDVDAALGDGGLGVSEVEEHERAVSTRSLVAARDLEAGTVLDADCFEVLRPGTGIAPADLAKVVGAVLTRPVRRHQPVTWADLGRVP